MAEATARRDFNNGHKTLNASEAKALQEILKSEKDKVNSPTYTITNNVMIYQRRNFEQNKYTMIRSRNPISGEATPREGKGEPIINPNHVVRDVKPRRAEKPLTEKIGVVSSRYDCLGNSPKSLSGTEPSVPSSREASTESRQQSRQQSRQEPLDVPKHAASALKFDSFGFVIEEE